MKYILIAAGILALATSAVSAQRMERMDERRGMGGCNEKRAEVRDFERRAMRDRRMTQGERARLDQLRRQANRACRR